MRTAQPAKLFAASAAVASMLLCAGAATAQSWGWRNGQTAAGSTTTTTTTTGTGSSFVASTDINGQRCVDLNNRAQQNLNQRIAAVKPGTADAGVGSILSAPVQGGSIFNIPNLGNLIGNAGIVASGGGSLAQQQAVQNALNSMNTWVPPQLNQGSDGNVNYTIPPANSGSSSGGNPVFGGSTNTGSATQTPPGQYTFVGPNGPITTYTQYANDAPAANQLASAGTNNTATAPTFSWSSPSTWTPYVKSLF